MVACGLAQSQQWCDKRIPTTCSSMSVVFPSQFSALWCEKAWNQILTADQRSAGSKTHISETCRLCGFGKQRFLDTLALYVEWHPCGGGQGCIILLSYVQLWVENNSACATVVLKPMEFLSRSCMHVFFISDLARLECVCQAKPISCRLTAVTWSWPGHL